MRAIVAARFLDYTELFESFEDFLYDDVKGFETIGPGLLCSLGTAVSLPFMHADGVTPATHDEIVAAWNALASPAAIATDKQGGAHYASLTSIRVTRRGLEMLAAGTLARFEAQLRHFWPRRWDGAPADAQLAALSKAWACGGGFPLTWPKYSAAFDAGEWLACADEATPGPAEMRVQNQSFHDRIDAEIRHLRAAATTTDPDELAIWP